MTNPKKRTTLGCALIAVAIIAGACASETDAPRRTADASPDAESDQPPGPIVFMRGDPSEGAIAYTIDPDGSREHQLGAFDFPMWSPDGTEILVFCCDPKIAHFADPITGEVVRSLPSPDKSLEMYCGGAWSPDGKRIPCLAFGVKDPKLNGIYSVRASDGGGLRRLTSNPGGEDLPGDYSPDGKQLVFVRTSHGKTALFVVNTDGTGLKEISPKNALVADTSAGSWSPDGSQILFVARPSESAHKEIWVVDPDGRSPHRFEMTPPCGGSFSDKASAGCYSPDWSPDGSMIVFTRSSPDGQSENIYIVNSDGTGLRQVTDGGGDDYPDWGAPQDT